MELLPDGSVKMDRNEAIEVMRDYHKKWYNAEKSGKWYEDYVGNFASTESNIVRRFQKRIEKYRNIKRKYDKFERIYQLMYKGKHIKD